MKKALIFSLIIFSGFFLSYSRAESAPPEDKGPLSKITFIHYRKGYQPENLPTAKASEAKPPWAGGGGGGTTGSGTESCYTYLAKDAKWKTLPSYIVNPTNEDGMDETWVYDTITASAEKWDTESGYSVFNSPALDTTASFDFDTYDGENVVMFGNYPNAGVIAVTNVWGYFGGKPSTRELVEWDMLFNESYDWGDATIDSTLMDLESIATHELGHSAGLGDLYDVSCSTMTMYGYGSEGETYARSLEDGDIAGIVQLYK